MSVICLRIGGCLGRLPDDPRLAHAYWERQKWLSDRDFLQLVDRSIAATGVRFATVNGMSMNEGMRWDLCAARELLGYVPLDGLPEAAFSRASARPARVSDPRRWRNPWLRG